MALGQRREVSAPRPRTVPPLRHYPRLLSGQHRRFDCGVAAPFPARDPRRANRSRCARPHGPADSPAPIPPARCRPKSRFFAPSSHLFSITVCDYTAHSTRPCAASVLSSKTSTMAPTTPSTSEFRLALGQFATGVTVVTAERAPGLVHVSFARPVADPDLRQRKCPVTPAGPAAWALRREHSQRQSASHFGILCAHRRRSADRKPPRHSIPLDGRENSAARGRFGAPDMQGSLLACRRRPYCLYRQSGAR